MAPTTLTALAGETTLQSSFVRDEDERPKVAYNNFSDDIPVISLDGIDDGERRSEICKKIVEACEGWGLFQVVDHGISTDLIKEMTRLAREFFALPPEEKLRFDMSGGKKGGFIVSSHLQGESVQDWREIVTYFSYPIRNRDYSRWPDKPENWKSTTEEYSDMLTGRTDPFPESGSSQDLLLTDKVSEYDEDEAVDTPEEILYMASFEELAKGTVKYDTIIWVSISLLLVLAWGVGIIMLLYLPFKRYVLQKDILSRKLYVTPTEIVYKVARPSYIPFLGVTTIERHVPLSLVIDIIIEQGCLQSICGVHTFRIESKAHGKAAPVDELLLQGVSNPGTLRKIIVNEASKAIQNSGISWKATTQINEGEVVARMGSLTEGPAILASPSKSIKINGSPRIGSVERRKIPADILLQRIDEVSESVKKIESLLEKSQASPRISQASPRKAEYKSIPPFPSLDDF